jgi:hypothetical protein
MVVALVPLVDEVAVILGVLVPALGKAEVAVQTVLAEPADHAPYTSDVAAVLLELTGLPALAT